MKKKISLKLITIALFLIMLGTSCASSLKTIPALVNRSLLIDSDTDDFIYPYEECNGSLFWKKCKHIIDRYDLDDKETRMKLKNMGFVLVRLEK